MCNVVFFTQLSISECCECRLSTMIGPADRVEYSVTGCDVVQCTRSCCQASPFNCCSSETPPVFVDSFRHAVFGTFEPCKHFADASCILALLQPSTEDATFILQFYKGSRLEACRQLRLACARKMHLRESKVRPMKQLVWLGHVLLLYDRMCCLMFIVLQRKVVHKRDMEVRQGVCRAGGICACRPSPGVSSELPPIFNLYSPSPGCQTRRDVPAPFSPHG